MAADEQGRFRLAEWSMEYVDLEDLGVVADAYARGYKTKKVALAIEYHTIGDEAATANAKWRRAEWRQKKGGAR